VRAASAIALLRSNQRNMLAEGLKALKDESVVVRLLVLDAIRQKPSPAAQAAVAAALGDSHPEVRALAVRAYAAIPGARQEVLTPLLSDPDPRVQLALLDLASANQLQIPAGALSGFRESRDPEVAAKANSMG